MNNTPLMQLTNVLRTYVPPFEYFGNSHVCIESDEPLILSLTFESIEPEYMDEDCLNNYSEDFQNWANANNLNYTNFQFNDDSVVFHASLKEKRYTTLITIGMVGQNTLKEYYVYDNVKKCKVLIIGFKPNSYKEIRDKADELNTSNFDY